MYSIAQATWAISQWKQLFFYIAFITIICKMYIHKNQNYIFILLFIKHFDLIFKRQLSFNNVSEEVMKNKKRKKFFLRYLNLLLI